QELSEAETTRQIQAYEAVADRDPRARIIRTDSAAETPEESMAVTLDRALDALFHSPRKLR
ncbi:MAG: hypothetical protein AAF368_08575, partial [Planctomycetota bacterium]